MLIFPVTFKIGIENQAADLRKKIEKLKRELTDGTALTFAHRTAKQNQLATLMQQLAALQTQLPGLGVKKIVHQEVSICSWGVPRAKPSPGFRMKKVFNEMLMLAK